MNINSYEFSEVYDILMKDVPYEKWVKLIDKLMNKKRDLLEIGCGTGELTKILGNKNYKITAVDSSENMLVKAYEKLRTMPNISIMKGDGRKFSIDKKFDGVLSSCDVVNYMLKKEDLHNFLKNSYEVLNKDGIIIFDLSSYSKLKNTLGNNIFINEEEGVFYSWENRFDERNDLLEMTLNFFVKEKSMYRRITEEQIQRAYKIEEVVKELNLIGFKDIRLFDNYKDVEPDEKSERIVFSAARR